MDSTTARLTSIRSTRIPCASTVLKPQAPVPPYTVRCHGSHPQHKPNRWNPRSGPCGLAPQGSTNWTYCHAMSKVHLPYSNTTHFVQLTLRRKPTLESSWPRKLLSTSPVVAPNSSWILVFFEHPQKTTNAPIRPLTGSFVRTMGSAPTSSLSTMH
jgi:hypothetical protein